MSRLSTQPQTAVHPFDTPLAEGIFKGLLWVVVILQAIILGREYNQMNQRAQRAAAAAQHRSH